MQSQGAIALQLARMHDVHDIAHWSAVLIEQGLPRAWTPARVYGQLRNRESTVLVAKSGDELAGFAIMEFGNTRAHLNLLAVRPEFRRRGVARQLLDWLHDSAITVGTFVVQLELRANNTAAMHFYSAMGYEVCGYVPRYYSNIEDAVRMSRDLTVRARPENLR